MAGFFDPSDAQQTAEPGAPAPADVATRLAAIKLILGRLASGGGAQTFGDYLARGPQRPSSAGVNEIGQALMQALTQPGAFKRGPSRVTQRPSSPSQFQDIASGVVTLALLRNILGASGGLGGIFGSGGGAGGSPSGSSMSTGDPSLDALIAGQYGGSPEMIPGGDTSLLPADYPGLNDGGGAGGSNWGDLSWLWGS